MSKGYRAYSPDTGEIRECSNLYTLIAALRWSIRFDRSYTTFTAVSKIPPVKIRVTQEMKRLLAETGMYAAYADHGEPVLLEVIE